MLCTLREAAAPVLGLAPEAVDLRIEIAGNDRNAAPEAASTTCLGIIGSQERRLNEG